MPTKKEKIMIYIEALTKQKLEIISAKDRRSMSNYIVMLIENDISKFELQNGKIPVLTAKE